MAEKGKREPKMIKFFKNWFQGIKNKWQFILVMCIVWIVLAYLWQIGKTNTIFMVLYYVSGALLAVDTNNIVGGVIGKAILLLAINGVVSTIFMHKGSWRMRMHYAKEAFFAGLKKVNNYVASFSVFWKKENDILALGVTGVGLSIIINSFLTGSATFVNSFVNVALFFMCLDQLQEKRGFLVACGNAVLKKSGRNEINGDSVIGFLDGIALGCLLAPLTYLIPGAWTSYVIGGALLLAGLVWFSSMKKKVAGVIALFLLFGSVTPAFAMIPPEESSIFTIDAEPSEMKRVAFFVLCNDMRYYREVEGYLVPKETKITMDNDVFTSDNYTDADYELEETYPGCLFGGIRTNQGFSTYKIFGEGGTNTIEVLYGVYEVIAKKDGKTERMYFAPDTTDERCYRVLADGEEVDSRKRVTTAKSKFTIYDAAGNKYELECMEDEIRPVTFSVQENGNWIKVDGFIIKEETSVAARSICQVQQNEYGQWIGWSMIYDGVSVSSTLSLITSDRSKPYGIERPGLWIATEDVLGVSYSDRELKPGEMEVITPEKGEEVQPIRLNKLSDCLGTTAKGQEIKKVLFQVGEEKKEGYLFPAESYVGLNKDIYSKGLYDGGYYAIVEDGTIDTERTSLFAPFDHEGMMTSGRVDHLYHIQMTNPQTGEATEVYFSFDTINPVCYEVLEEQVIVEEAEPLPDPEPVIPETEDTETELPEEESTQVLVPEDGKTEEDDEDEEEEFFITEDIAKVPAIAVAATVLAGALSAVGASIVPGMELASGIKARRGELHVNGDVDVPDVHFEQLAKLVVPVHVSDGEGITWVIVAKVFTPGVRKLVKAVAVPMGADGANIHLELAENFKKKVSGKTTVYLEVVATGIDVNGECNLLEKMVEINIVTE